MVENVFLKDCIELEHYRKGVLLSRSKLSDLITSVGVDLICDSISRATGRPAVANYIAIGASGTPPSRSDTALGQELFRALASYSHTSGTNYWTLEVTFSFTGSYVIRESGVFNASSGGTMLARRVFDPITVSSGDTLKVTWKFTVQT